MPDWPSGFGGTRMASVGAVLASTTGTSVAAHGSAGNTKGNWVELSSAAPWDVDGFYVQVKISGGGDEFLIDVGVGANPNEVVILPDLGYSTRTAADPRNLGYSIYVPLPIKAGERIVARCQETGATSTIEMILQLVAGDFYSMLRCGRATNYGAVAATSRGTQVDAGASANTKGAWTELSASIANPFRYLIVCLSQDDNAANSNQTGFLDIGVGANPNEVVIVPDILYMTNTLETIHPPWAGFFASAKAGSRLVARNQSSINTATDRVIAVSVIGFD